MSYIIIYIYSHIQNSQTDFPTKSAEYTCYSLNIHIYTQYPYVEPKIS